MTPRILAFGGSLRRGSLNQLLVGNAARGARAAGAEVTVIALRDYPLPVYDGDLDAAEGIPAEATELKILMKSHDGLLISSPEYNSSLTAALKNAIDWASRPTEGDPPLACFRGKVAGIMAASPGGLGGLRGLVHLRAILSNLSVLVLPEQRAVAAASNAFDGEGRLLDDKTRESVEKIGFSVATVAARLATVEAAS